MSDLNPATLGNDTHHRASVFGRLILWVMALACLTIVFAPIATASESYKQGIAAYLNEDYIQAKSAWERGAAEQDARSMFNLGLLHQQQKISNASDQLAEQWFERSAEAGYVPAKYHLAKLLLAVNDQDDAAVLLIEEAAAANYAPALRYLGRGREYSRTATRSVRANPGQQSSVRTASNQVWLRSQPVSYWTIQLLAFNERERVEEFVKQNQLSADFAIFREPSRGVEFFKLVYGSFPDKQAANLARDSLPEQLRKYSPWVRSFTDVLDTLNSSAE